MMDTQEEIMPANTKEERAVARAGRKVDYSQFESTVKELNTSPGKLCEGIGYDSTTWMGWRDSHKMPQVAAIACEAMRRRQKGADGGGSIYLVRVATASDAEVVERVLRGLGVTIIPIE